MAEPRRAAFLAAFETSLAADGVIILALKNMDGERIESALTHEAFASVLSIMIGSAVKLASRMSPTCAPITTLKHPDEPIPASQIAVAAGRCDQEVLLHLDLGPLHLVFAIERPLLSNLSEAVRNGIAPLPTAARQTH
jgi:hypothetical protein